jgi:hypothetical protein
MTCTLSHCCVHDAPNMFSADIQAFFYLNCVCTGQEEKEEG